MEQPKGSGIINIPSPPGYANEVGEAFRSLVPVSVVWLSYGVSSSYVLADAIDKGKKARDVSVNLPLNPPPPSTPLVVSPQPCMWLSPSGTVRSPQPGLVDSIPRYRL